MTESALELEKQMYYSKVTQENHKLLLLLIELGEAYDRGELVYLAPKEEPTLFKREREPIWPKFQEWWRQNK